MLPDVAAAAAAPAAVPLLLLLLAVAEPLACGLPAGCCLPRFCLLAAAAGALLLPVGVALRAGTLEEPSGAALTAAVSAALVALQLLLLPFSGRLTDSAALGASVAGAAPTLLSSFSMITGMPAIALPDRLPLLLLLGRGPDDARVSPCCCCPWPAKLHFRCLVPVKDADATEAGAAAAAGAALPLLLLVVLAAEAVTAAAAAVTAAAAAAASFPLAAWLLVNDPLVASIACFILRAGSATAARLRTERRHSRQSVLQTGSSSIPVSSSSAAMSRASDNRVAGAAPGIFPSGPVPVSAELALMKFGDTTAGFLLLSVLAACAFAPLTATAAAEALVAPPFLLLPPSCCFTLLGESLAGSGFRRMLPCCATPLPLLVDAVLILAAAFCFEPDDDPLLLLLVLLPRRTRGWRGAGGCFVLGRNTCGCAKKPSLFASWMAWCSCLVRVKI
jgi:hypothetical protein